LLDRDETVNLQAATGWDGTRRERERFLVAALAVAFVLLRSVVPTVYEGFYFDSDQAIVGLMARHLSNFQRFPLFYYGLNYILGVESWIIAPFFWTFGSSVAVMRLPLVALNALVAVWLMTALGRGLSLRPFVAFVAALPFIMPTPAVSSQLLETAGACVEPFVYVLLLWRLRHRPLPFGALLALGFLHREFTIFAVPALVLVEAASGELQSVAAMVNIRRASLMAVGFGIVWLAIHALKLYLSGAPLGLQAASLAGQMCLSPHEWTGRAQSVFTEALPALFGGRFTRLQDFRMNTPVTAGYAVVGLIVAAAIAAMTARILASWVHQRRLDKEDGFAVYLGLIGVFAAGAYPLSCNVIPGQPPLLRYLLFGLLLPIGCFAVFARRERSRVLRTALAGVLVLWAAVNLFDNVGLIRASVNDPPSNEHRELADYLVSHQIRYGRATYWDAYVVDFLSRERVIVASVDLIRIPEYQQRVDEHAASAVNLPRLPCTGGERVASWCVQPP
jgi:hypothetical protein